MKDILIRLLKVIAVPSAIIFIPYGFANIMGFSETYVLQWFAGFFSLVGCALILCILIGVVKYIITGDPNLFE